MGAPVVPATRVEYEAGTRTLFGKAFDCRVGVAAMLLALRELSTRDLAVDVVGSLSSQEELGCRGVASCVRHFSPAACFVFEGAPADDTFRGADERECVFRAGPMLRHADTTMLANPRYQRLVLETAARGGIPAQASVRSGGGTNASVAHLMDEGIPCVVASVPCRYIHSECSLASLDDVKNTARLAVAVVQGLSPEIIAGF